ncbi:MAG: PQQ-binding-like beta-propeller repeat protein [Chloroflexaceae bacterium]|nr:PQQ-binding-like beta-propeller repeat protein [Chloroflexaceae bacterium]
MSPTVPLAAGAIQVSTIGEVHQIARLGKGGLDDAAFSPDGATVAVASSIGVWLYGTETFDERYLIAVSKSIEAVAFSPDSTVLALATSDNVTLYQVADGSTTLTLEPESFAESLAYAPDGAALAVGLTDGSVAIFDPGTGSLLQTLEGHGSSVSYLAYSPDGAMLASSNWGSDSSVRVWNVADGSEVLVLEDFEEGWAEEIIFLPDSTGLAVSVSGDLVFYNLPDGTERLRTEIFGSVEDLAFSPDGATLAVATGFDIMLLNPSDGSEILTIEDYEGTVRSLAYAPDGATLMSAHRDGTVVLWNVADGSEIRRLEPEGPTQEVNTVAYSPDGALLAAGTGDGVMVWSTRDGSLVNSLESTNWVQSIAYSPDGSLLALASYGDVTLSRESGSSSSISIEDAHESAINGLAFSPDGTMLATASDDGTVKLWNVADGSEIRMLESNLDEDAVNAVAFSPDGSMLVSGSDDETAKVWNVADGSELHTMYHKDSVYSVAFSPDGTTLATSTGGGEVMLWDVASGSDLRKMEGSGWMYSVTFSPDGAIVASGGSDGSVYLWATADGRELAMLKGHTGGVVAVAFAPDGSTLATGSDDRTVRFWGTGEELVPPPTTVGRPEDDEAMDDDDETMEEEGEGEEFSLGDTFSGGEEAVSQAGFAVMTPDGWEAMGLGEGTEGMIMMSPSGTDFSPDTAMSMMFMAGPTDDIATEVEGEVSPDAILDAFVESGELTNAVLADQREDVVIGGVPGRAVDIVSVENEAGASGGQGRMAVAVNEDNMTLIMFGLAPTDTWDLDLFDATMATVRFFEPAPESEEPDITDGAPAEATPGASSETTTREVPGDSTMTLPGGEEVRQWALSATASSEYGTDSWTAAQATGEPDTTTCGDYGTAWASSDSTTVEWLEVQFATPVTPTQVNIIQTYNPSQVSKVELRDTDGLYHEVYSAVPETVEAPCPYTLSIPVEAADATYLADGVKITVDQSVVGTSWNEIDAVELVGMSAEE